MLPFYDRTLSVPRKDVAPVWTRSWPIHKEPTTLGQHLKKKRFMAGMRQQEGARKLGVSWRALSDWETDRIYPSWSMQPRLTAYLGFDPFSNPTLGKAKSNETNGVAFLSPEAPLTIGQKIKQRRFKLKKTRKELASELAISVKTLWGWETDRWLPIAEGQELVAKFLDGAS